MISSKAIKVSSSVRCQDTNIVHCYHWFHSLIIIRDFPPTSLLNPAKSCLITISNPSEADLCGHFGRYRAGADPSTGTSMPAQSCQEYINNNFHGNRVSHCRCFSPKVKNKCIVLFQAFWQPSGSTIRHHVATPEGPGSVTVEGSRRMWCLASAKQKNLQSDSENKDDAKNTILDNGWGQKVNFKYSKRCFQHNLGICTPRRHSTSWYFSKI